MREKRIEEKLRKAIAAHGELCYKFVSPGNAGVPDRLVVLPDGRVIFVELKTAQGKLSALQRRQIDRMRARHLDVRVLSGPAAVRAFVEEVFPDAVSTPSVSDLRD